MTTATIPAHTFAAACADSAGSLGTPEGVLADRLETAARELNRAIQALNSAAAAWGRATRQSSNCNHEDHRHIAHFHCTISDMADRLEDVADASGFLGH